MVKEKEPQKQIVEVKKEKKQNKKINFKSIDKNFIISQIFYWIFVAVTIFYFREAVFETKVLIKNILLVATLIMAVAVDVILVIFNKKEIEYHKQFIILALAFGLFYFLATPFPNGTDEGSHFLRVFKLSTKYTSLSFEEDSLFPPAFQKAMDYNNNRDMTYENYANEFEAFSMNSEERRDLIGYYWNIKLYSPLQYIPQIIGVTAGRIISDNVVIIGMCGRITGYIFWLALCAYAIKIMPNKKMFLTILCLLPVNIFSAVCISGDTVTNAVCTYFIAFIYRKVYLREKLTKKEQIIATITACMIALCKIVYLPFVTLVLLLKYENFENKKDWKKFVIILITLSVIVGFGWLVIGSMNLASSNEASGDQLKFILNHPFEYILVILNTMTAKGAQFIYQLCTGDELMCHAKTTVYPIISYIYSIILFLSVFMEEKKEKIELNLVRKIWIFLIMFGTGLLICTAIYIQWTSLWEVGKDSILGIQGRYFIPVAALLIFFINKSKFETNPKTLMNILIIMQMPVICQIMNVFV
ncbi:MAG: DUF2142 domain-containing protein [Clostridia bacterium]|nr:DUF2142 domain-containing protein [Clostridia bacterium]